MIGVAVILVGWVALVAGVVLTVGSVALIPAGLATVAAGFLIDFDKAREEAPRGKRR